MSSLVLRDAEVDGVRVDVRVEEGLITMVGPRCGVRGADVVVECGGGALLPGLHDHHLHLLSMAAAAASVDVSGGLDGAIRSADAQTLPGAAIRAVRYDEVRDGPLDRWRLDALAPGRAVRVQHRSGALWVLSTVALQEVGAFEAEEEGIERDDLDRPTGRLFRLDGWLRGRLPGRVPPDLAAVGRRLASYGVTGVTDCTPAAVTAYFEPIAGAVRSGALPVTVWVTGGPELSEATPPHPLQQGPVKILITDHAFPSLEQVSDGFARAHLAGRAVAVHCVSRAGLLLALAAWRAVGSVPGDRVEHASVVPPEAVASLRELSLTVVTQPAFVAARGDEYLAEVEAADRPDLYRCASLQEGGVAVGGSTDAPFGPDDPWVAIRAAIERRAASGAQVGSDRGLQPAAALDLFLGPPEHPGGPRRRVTPGATADLCLLDVPLRTALLEPHSGHVVTTIARGRRTYTA
ncbi:MAG: amidohydrolase family protein [Acidimicrobiales bacterium]